MAINPNPEKEYSFFFFFILFLFFLFSSGNRPIIDRFFHPLIFRGFWSLVEPDFGGC